MNSNHFYPSIIEKELIDELQRQGILCEAEFNIRTGKKQWFEIDIYIKSPIRGAIEIMAQIDDSRISKKQKVSMIERRITTLRQLKAKFKGNLIIFLIYFGKLDKQELDLINSSHVISSFPPPTDRNKTTLLAARYIAYSILKQVSKEKELSIQHQNDNLKTIKNGYESLVEHNKKFQNLIFNHFEDEVDKSQLEEGKKLIHQDEILVNQIKQQLIILEEELDLSLNELTEIKRKLDEYKDWEDPLDFVMRGPGDKPILPDMMRQGKRRKNNVFPKKDRIYSIDTLEQEAGKLSDILVSFRPFMNVNHFETLKQEITQFNEEYISGHYTTAALRVGRTLEHVIYTLAQALNVDVNKKTLKILDDIDNSFNQIRKHFINFSNIEQNKRSGKKKNLIKNITNMTAKLVSLATEIDNEHEEKIAGIVNTESILRDIKAKFDHIKEIRDELRELENSNLIKKITDKRNEAAHANLSGEVTEFTKNDIDEIIETLRTILFRLVNIHQIYLNLPSKPQK